MEIINQKVVYGESLDGDLILKKIIKNDLPGIKAENQSIKIVKVKSVKKIMNEAVYDIAVNNNHNFFADDLLVHNCFEISFLPKTKDGRFGLQFCNLTSINGSKITSLELWKQAVEAATIIGTLQAGYTSFKYLSSAAKELTEQEALLGVSLTGWFDNPDILLNPENQYMIAKLAVKVNKEWAQKLGIKQAARVTCVKPEGCQVKETIVSTDQGLLKLEELGNIEGEKWQNIDVGVYTDRGLKKSSKFYVNGFAKTKKITLDSGIILESTFNHKYRVISNGEYIWKTASEIKENDIFPYSLGDYNGGSIQSLTFEFFNKNKHDHKPNIMIPDKLDTDLAWFIGVYFGDGSNHEKGIRIHGNYEEQKGFDRLIDIAKTKFGIEAQLLKHNTDPKDKRCSLYFNSVKLLDFLKENGILKENSENINFPLIIRKSTKEIILSFIDGYSVADGCDKNSRSKTWCTISKNMANELVVILRALGIDSKVREMPPTETSFGNKMRYWISTRKGRNIQKFAGKDSWKKEIWDILDKKSLSIITNVDKVSKIEDSENYTFDLQVDDIDHTYLSNSYISHNTSSLFLGSSSGIHPHHDHRYFRRVQMNKQDNVYQYFKMFNPHAVEESVWSATKTDDVITFPLEIPKSAKVKNDITAIQHLNYVKQVQENWVNPGTTEANTKNVTHNVSVTVECEENEFEDVTKYLFENRQYFAAVSLLPKTGDKLYKQPPLQRVYPELEKDWDDLVENWSTVNYMNLMEDEDNTSLAENLACAGGACDVTYLPSDKKA